MSIPQSSVAANAGIDIREQLFNNGESGPVAEVSTPTGCITSLSGILLDFDLPLFRPSAVIPNTPLNPVDFYQQVLRHWLDRHELARNSEVRMSGTGLHSLVRFKEPVVFRTDSERKRWGGIVKVIQASLPTDPDAPGINALTRPIGSINSKNGFTVTQLTLGQPVEAETVVEFYQRMLTSPFRTAMQILLGTERVEPCPICQKPTAKLTALDHVGKCYGSCGKVTLGQLYDTVLKKREVAQ